MSKAIDELKELKAGVHNLIGGFALGETRANLAIAEFYLGAALELSHEDAYGREDNG